MKHKGSKTLETKRLILRKFEENDAVFMFNNWASDSEVTKFLRWPAHSSVEISKKVLCDWVESNEQLNNYQWAIVLKDINEPIGSIGAVDMNEKIGMIHIGYAIGRKWWGSGITAEALNKLMDFFFNEVEALRIESMHDPNNPNSGRVMQKCGLIKEAEHIDYEWHDGKMKTRLEYRLLKKEWR